ncbi:transposase [Alienimonas sp. DA493]|uniref:IS701 family transposase n=1 Tax=Alienimonas sp. DA493 TaxID=3373605 RepID=UPI003754435E
MATSFTPLLQVFARSMTRPTRATLTTLLAGWICAPRRTILGMVRAAGAGRHHAAFHRLFASAAWSVDRVGLAAFDLFSAGTKIASVAVDDTLLPRRGLKVFGTGMHRDPLLSSRGHTSFAWGHCWVVLGVVVESRHVPGRRFTLPVLCRLYLNRASAAKWKRTYRKKTELTLDMLRIVERHVGPEDKRLHLLGDAAYTAPAVLAQMPDSVAVTGRVVSNVRLCEPPPPRRPGQNGRPRIRGASLPNPRQMLAAKGLPRRTLKLYDGPAYQVRLAEGTGRFHKAPHRRVKVVAIEHLRGGRGVEAFYTAPAASDGEAPGAETILRRYSWRWSIEVTFRDAKQRLGIAQPQNRTTKAARRTAATGFLLYGLVVWWHETVRPKPADSLRDWSGKSGASFADMLAALRLECLETTARTGSPTPAREPGVRKLWDRLKTLVILAA